LQGSDGIDSMSLGVKEIFDCQDDSVPGGEANWEGRMRVRMVAACSWIKFAR